jgi:hypothetical protein
MTEPTPFELQQAEVARKAMGKGYTLVTHLHFSLVKNGQFVVDQAESLDDISDLLDKMP